MTTRRQTANDTTQPDGSLRKLMDSSRLNALGWQAKINLGQGLAMAYQDFMHQISLQRPSDKRKQLSN
jgi:GDP-L-fucose synthase